MSVTQYNIPSPGSTQTLGISPFTLTTYPKIHGLVGAQFGDLEYDVGKSVRWLDFFTDDVFIVDINTGEQRYWVINWAVSFPGSKHTVSGRNFFYSPSEAAIWRKEQFQWADAAFGYSPGDWCLFVDGHEGLSMDNRTLPTDYATAPFGSWIFREIERVGAGDRVVIPFYAYLKFSDLQNITYGSPANQTGFSIQQAVSVPWYLPVQGLTRLVKVSALRNSAFDWTIIDQPHTPTSGCQLQIISYGYAHWNVQDIPAGQVSVPPLDATNDLGWKMRQLISVVRPLPGIPLGTWQGPTSDPTSYPGPWCVDTTSSLGIGIATTVEEDGHTTPATQCAAIRVPLYDTVMRLNLRDGLWYERDASGNVPLTWDNVNQVWVPNYDTAQWDQYGVNSNPGPDIPTDTTSLLLDGVSGSYTFTSDANYFDFQQSFSLAAVIQFTTYHGAQQCITAKWDTAGQRSWYWTIETDGSLTLAISRDGTAAIQFSLPAATAALVNNTPVALGVSFFTTTDVPPVDQVRFWKWNGTVWNLLAMVTQPNPANAHIFNSTVDVEVGAMSGGLVSNAAGAFRIVVYHAGGGDSTVFGSQPEVARMRGDVTSNPSYDRYGNLWNNQGGWSYSAMPGAPNPTVLGLFV